MNKLPPLSKTPPPYFYQNRKLCVITHSFFCLLKLHLYVCCAKTKLQCY